MLKIFKDIVLIQPLVRTFVLQMVQNHPISHQRPDKQSQNGFLKDGDTAKKAEINVYAHN